MHSVNTLVMGNFEEAMAKRERQELRDPYEDNIGKKRKRDQRAFGSPFKNPGQVNTFLTYLSQEISFS